MSNSITATAANTVNTVNTAQSKLDRISFNSSEAIQKLGELHRVYGHYPITQVPILTVMFERTLCEQLVEADLEGKLNCGLETNRRTEEEAGDLESMAGRLLKHYCTMRGLYEGSDIAEFIDEGESLEDFLKNAKRENENVFYAAQYLLDYSALGYELDTILNEEINESWNAMNDENSEN